MFHMSFDSEKDFADFIIMNWPMPLVYDDRDLSFKAVKGTVLADLDIGDSQVPDGFKMVVSDDRRFFEAYAESQTPVESLVQKLLVGVFHGRDISFANLSEDITHTLETPFGKTEISLKRGSRGITSLVVRIDAEEFLQKRMLWVKKMLEAVVNKQRDESFKIVKARLVEV